LGSEHVFDGPPKRIRIFEPVFGTLGCGVLDHRVEFGETVPQIVAKTGKRLLDLKL